MMKFFLICLLTIFSSRAHTQNYLKGKYYTQSYLSIKKYIPVFADNQYGYLFVPKKMKGLQMLSGINRTSNIEFNYAKKFEIIRVDLLNMKTKSKEFHLIKHQAFLDYVVSENNIIIVSRNRSNNKETFYLSLYSFTQFKQLNKTKAIVKFQNDGKRKLEHISYKGKYLNVIIKYAYVENMSQKYLLIQLDDFFNRVHFKEFSIPSSSGKWEFQDIWSSDETTSLSFVNKSIIRDSIQAEIKVININWKEKKGDSKKIKLIDEVYSSIALGEENRLSLIQNQKDFRKLSLLYESSGQRNEIALPEIFVQKTKKMQLGFRSNEVLKYFFIKINATAFSIQSYYDYLVYVNGQYTVQQKFGPSVVFKMDFEEPKIEWYFENFNLDKKSIKPTSKLLSFSNSKNCYILYNHFMKIYQIKINAESGESEVSKPFDGVKKLNRSSISGAFLNSKTNKGILIVIDGAIKEKVYPVSVTF